MALRPWQPGESGNPGGRAKLPVQVRDLAREHTVEAIETLIAVMRDKKSGPMARVNAAEAILDRGWGRPPQAITGGDGAALQLEVIQREAEVFRNRIACLIASQDASEGHGGNGDPPALADQQPASRP